MEHEKDIDRIRSTGKSILTSWADVARGMSHAQGVSYFGVTDGSNYAALFFVSVACFFFFHSFYIFILFSSLAVNALLCTSGHGACTDIAAPTLA